MLKPLKQILALSTSNIAGPLVIFIATPEISKTYTPESFGEFTFYFGIIPILTILFSGLMFHGIIKEENTQKALLFFAAAKKITLAALTIATTILFITSLTLKIKTSEILLTLLIAYTGTQIQLFNVLFSRFGSIKQIVKTTIIRAIIVVALQIIFGKLYSHHNSLLLGYLISEAIVILLNSRHTKKTLPHQRKTSIKPNKINYYIKKNLLFFKYYAPSQIISTATNFIPVITMHSLGSLANLGAYGIILRLYGTPIYSIANAIRSIYWRWISENNISAKRISSPIAASGYTLVFAFSILSFSLNIKPASLVLSPEWHFIDNYFTPYLCYFSLSFLNTFLTEALKNSNKQRTLLISEALGLPIKALIILVPLLCFDFQDVLLLTAISGIAFNSLATLYYLSAIKELPHQNAP